jgi:hypothetical protein
MQYNNIRLNPEIQVSGDIYKENNNIKFLGVIGANGKE